MYLVSEAYNSRGKTLLLKSHNFKRIENFRGLSDFTSLYSTSLEIIVYSALFIHRKKPFETVCDEWGDPWKQDTSPSYSHSFYQRLSLLSPFHSIGFFSGPVL